MTTPKWKSTAKVLTNRNSRMLTGVPVCVTRLQVEVWGDAQLDTWDHILAPTSGPLPDQKNGPTVQTRNRARKQTQNQDRALCTAVALVQFLGTLSAPRIGPTI